jgi:hypothetical protein
MISLPQHTGITWKRWNKRKPVVCINPQFCILYPILEKDLVEQIGSINDWKLPIMGFAKSDPFIYLLNITFL